MSITNVVTNISMSMNQINPKTEKENALIQYGLELILDNILKIAFILLFWSLIGKGTEAFCVLCVFCIFRSLAGGVHFHSNWGCTLSMFVITGISILFHQLLFIPDRALIVVCLLSIFAILIYVPKTINIKYFSAKMIIRKKVLASVFIILAVLISYFNFELRTLIVIPAIIEVVSLIPKIKEEEVLIHERKTC